MNKATGNFGSSGCKEQSHTFLAMSQVVLGVVELFGHPLIDHCVWHQRKVWYILCQVLFNGVDLRFNQSHTCSCAKACRHKKASDAADVGENVNPNNDIDKSA